MQGKKNRNLACITRKQVILSEAVIQKCSVKNVGLQLYYKTDSGTGFFM